MVLAGWLAADRLVDHFVTQLKAGVQQQKQSIVRYLTKHDRADHEPALVAPARVSQLKEKIASVKEHVGKLSKIQRRLLQTPDQQISHTDPHARSMATSGRGTGIVGYNVEAAVDAEHHMIVAHEVTNVGHDRAQLAATGRSAQEATREEKMTVLADRGNRTRADVATRHTMLKVVRDVLDWRENPPPSAPHGSTGRSQYEGQSWGCQAPAAAARTRASRKECRLLTSYPSLLSPLRIFSAN